MKLTKYLAGILYFES